MYLQLLFNGRLFLGSLTPTAILVAPALLESKTDISPLQGDISDNGRNGYLWGHDYFITPNVIRTHPHILGRMFSANVQIDHM